MEPLDQQQTSGLDRCDDLLGVSGDVVVYIYADHEIPLVDAVVVGLNALHDGVHL